MAYDSLSPQQQELLDLLRNEVAEYVGNEPDDLWQRVDRWRHYFEHLNSQLEHLARAAQMVGLHGLGLSCNHLVKIFAGIASARTAPSPEVQALMARWAVVFLGYLQHIFANGFNAQACKDLLAYLQADEWPEPLTPEEVTLLEGAFECSEVVIDEDSETLYPDDITQEHASLAIPHDVHPELLDGLITELPVQAEFFSAAIDHYIHTSDASYLLTAQRVAHTVKGAGNVVGIHGVANLMHYCEDLLETHQKGIDMGDAGFADLLLDAADCLANIADFLQGFAPAPDNIHTLLMSLVGALTGEAVQAEASVTAPLEGTVDTVAFADDDMAAADTFITNDTVVTDDALVMQDELQDADALAMDALQPVNDTKDSAYVAQESMFAGDLDAEFESLAADFDDLFGNDTQPATSDKHHSSDEHVLGDHAVRGPLDYRAVPLVLTESFESEVFTEGVLTDIDRLIGAELPQELPQEVSLNAQSLPSITTKTAQVPAGEVQIPATALEIDAEPTVILSHAGHRDLLQGDALQEKLSQQDDLQDNGVLSNQLQTDALKASAPRISTAVPNATTSLAMLEAKPQFNLTLSDEKATELLRVAGEVQISNTQIQSRVNSTLSVVEATLRFQQQLLDLAGELDKSLAQQSAAFIAANAGDDTHMDPLELERYHELHSFASRLQEVTTDAHEAVQESNQSLMDLQTIIGEQRQLGFEMQNQVLGIRLLPASILSSRFTRGVRQAARLTHKAATLEIIGDDVLVDSRVLNSIADPVLHLLRNAVDHGLEQSALEREQKGKSAEGKITLTFERIGDTIKVRVSDDGQGIDYRLIEKIAIERGIVSTEQSHTHSELDRIILMPGFSTRSAVTQTSGRGIGLDVVSDQVRQLKGYLSVHSEADQGTTFELSMPMSVLSAHMLMVNCADQVHGIISRGLQQIAHLQAGDLQQDDQKRWFYDFYGKSVPVFFLNQMVGVDDGFSTDATIYRSLLITPKADGELCGVAVEQITASEEHVIKPLGRFSYHPAGVTGAAILGNGAIAPVLDIHDFPVLRFTEEERKHWQERTALLGVRKKPVVATKPIALIADDSLSARRALAQFMADFGYDVVTARDGFDAINQMAELPEGRAPVIALLDLEMPRMNGLELTAHMRSQPDYQRIPIAMVTSRTTARHKVMAKSAGVGAYLNKPWSDDELTQVLTELLPQDFHAVSA
ncbi:hybrid sensor histidine kinase/response regulator [Marinagarivorans algicola]|uniref:hybrid sensor histidine kinase/response regulator n=1 Tax=Marinagarivorans algicola TaxID=1513270 RepID=UPI00373621F1